MEEIKKEELNEEQLKDVNGGVNVEFNDGGVFVKLSDDNTNEVTNNMKDCYGLVFGLAQSVVTDGASYEGDHINEIEQIKFVDGE